MKNRFHFLILVVLIFIILVQSIPAGSLENSIVIIEVEETDLVKLNVEAKDPDGDILTYHFEAPLDKKGEWQTDYGDEGEYVVEVTVSDGEFFVTQDVKIIVHKKLVPADIIIKKDKFFVTEGDFIEFNVSALNILGEETDNIVAENLPEDAYFDGELFEWQIPDDLVERNYINKIFRRFGLNWFNSKKTQTILFKAELHGIESSKEIEIIIEDGNKAPILEDVDDIIVKEGQRVWFSPKATDPDGDYIKYSFSGDINKNGWQTTYGDAGVYYVNVTASDGFLEDTKEVKVIVEHVNRAPIMTGTTDAKSIVKEGDTIVIEIDAYDPDGDEITIEVEQLPPGSVFENNTFVWEVGYDFVSMEEGQKDINITFVASDGELVSVKGYRFTVKNVNRPPEILNFTPPARIVSHVGAIIPFEVEVYDPDGNELTVSWRFGWLGRRSPESTNTTHVRKFTSSGNKRVTVYVSDGEDTVSHTWNVRIPRVKTEKVPIEKAVRKPEEKTPKERDPSRTVIYENVILTNVPAGGVN